MVRYVLCMLTILVRVVSMQSLTESDVGSTSGEWGESHVIEALTVGKPSTRASPQ